MNNVKFKKLGIIVLNYNNWEDTYLCIDSLLKFIDFSFTNVYIVDNNSSIKPSIKFIDKVSKFNSIKIIYSKHNKGFSAGNNIGIKHAMIDKCDFFLITNNDVIFNDRSFYPLMEYLDNNSDVGIIGPKVYLKDGSIQDIGAPREMSLKTKYKYLVNKISFGLFFSSYNIKVESLKHDFTRPKTLYYISGCCFMFSEKFLDLIFPMNESLFLYYEEYVLGRIMKLNNFKVVYYPFSDVIHFGSQSTKKIGIKSLIYLFQSEYYYFVNSCGNNKFFYLPIFLFRYFQILSKIIISKNFKINLKFFKETLKKMV
jgi:GT2 family glycosyltransferase